ncbi:MAG: hypothetical protein IKX76_01735 [Eubacterium sp.]|nr:hypothetical protein [Eubacterium sp.]
MIRKGNFISRMYGFDCLSILFILICCILNLITFLRPSGSFLYLGVVGYLFLILVVIRAVSFNYEQRQRENEVFLDKLKPLFRGMDLREEEKGQKDIFRFFNCPDCKQRIRVPRGKGKIEITCPQCGTKFIKKT